MVSKYWLYICFWSRIFFYIFIVLFCRFLFERWGYNLSVFILNFKVSKWWMCWFSSIPSRSLPNFYLLAIFIVWEIDIYYCKYLHNIQSIGKILLELYSCSWIHNIVFEFLAFLFLVKKQILSFFICFWLKIFSQKFFIDFIFFSKASNSLWSVMDEYVVTFLGTQFLYFYFGQVQVRW